jgi:hypothetical protein
MKEGSKYKQKNLWGQNNYFEGQIYKFIYFKENFKMFGGTNWLWVCTCIYPHLPMSGQYIPIIAQG